MNTGSIITGRPSMGSWVLYGLGAETENLPGFVVLRLGGQGRPDAADRGAPVVGRHAAEQVPGREASTRSATRCCYITNPHGRQRRRCRSDSIDAINALNRLARPRRCTIPEIQTRIAQYEMAFKMQTSVPGADRHAQGAAARLDMYGAQAGRRLVRLELPAGAPAGRARRALHPALPPRLGPPQRRRRTTSSLKAAGSRPGRRRR